MRLNQFFRAISLVFKSNSKWKINKSVNKRWVGWGIRGLGLWLNWQVFLTTKSFSQGLGFSAYTTGSLLLLVEAVPAVGSYTLGDLHRGREVNNKELKLTALLSPDKSLTLWNWFKALQTSRYFYWDIGVVHKLKGHLGKCRVFCNVLSKSCVD